MTGLLSTCSVELNASDVTESSHCRPKHEHVMSRDDSERTSTSKCSSPVVSNVLYNAILRSLGVARTSLLITDSWNCLPLLALFTSNRILSVSHVQRKQRAFWRSDERPDRTVTWLSVCVVVVQLVVGRCSYVYR